MKPPTKGHIHWYQIFCPFKRGCPLFRGYKCIQKQAFRTTLLFPLLEVTVVVIHVVVIMVIMVLINGVVDYLVCSSDLLFVAFR